MTRTYKGKEVSLEELFQLFHRFCKDNNIKFHTATQCNILGELLVFDLSKGIGNWIRCTQDEDFTVDVYVLYEFFKHYNSSNIEIIMERFDSFLTEMNLKKAYIDAVNEEYDGRDILNAIKLKICLGPRQMFPKHEEEWLGHNIRTWLEYAEDLKGLEV